MPGKSRARGDKEPKGKTKAFILLFLAENGESTYTEVREYLRERFNIRSGKDVKIHLDGLASDDKLGLIDKIPHGNGIANSYKIRGGFDSLKKLHGFLNGHGMVPEFMKTGYFIQYTASKGFDTMARTNIVRNQMLELYEGIMDDKGHEKISSLLTKVKKDDHEAISKWMSHIRSGDREYSLSGNFLAIVDLFKEGSIDQLGEIFLGIVRILDANDDKTDLNEFFGLMSDLGLSEEDHVMVNAALRISPGALDFLLNSSKNNRLFAPNIFLAYVFSLILETPGKNYVPDSIPPVDFGKYRRYASNMPTLYKRSPMATIVRSMFIADMVRGNLIDMDVPEDVLKTIFSK